MDLARLRFDQGLSSIVEFNQAELNRTRAEIGVAVAIHDLRIRNDGLEYAVGTLQ
jgi:outer membrane protein TolC